MSVEVADGVIHVRGNGRVEDAEPILAALQDDPAAVINLSGATRLHSATIQLLVALRPRIAGAPSDPFQARHIIPLLVDAP